MVDNASQRFRNTTNNQQFGNTTVSNGSLLLQGVVQGDIHWSSPKSEIRSIDIASGATFNAANKTSGPCLENTRVDILRQISAWADGESNTHMYWLKGMAGTGKSTIALTVSRKYARDKRLGASFFFSRDIEDLAAAQKFVTTIARQLAENVPDLEEHINHALASSSTILDMGIHSQWEKLILEPVSQLRRDASVPPILIVVDALDECDDEDGVALLIKCFKDAAMVGMSPLRIFITSRQVPRINYEFEQMSPDNHRDFILHNIEDSIVKHDLKLFYREKLMAIAQRFKLGIGLYSDDMIEVLAERSHGLFIHAATVCRFISEGEEFALQRLSLLVDTGTALNQEKELDLMYTTVLTHSWPPSAPLEPHERDQRRSSFRRIVGSIAVLYDLMTIYGLAELLNVPAVEVDRVLRSFQSVLDVPENVPGEKYAAIRLLHPSFRDFLLDPTRCTNGDFSIKVQDIHAELFDHCLRLMRNHLKTNICQLAHPGIRASDISKAKVDESIPRAVQYACRYWFYHFQQIESTETTISDVLNFLEKDFLHWLEVLSLLHRLPEAVTIVRLLGVEFPPLPSSWLSWAKSWRKKSDTLVLSETIYDATRFLRNHGSIIEECPLQLYCSALIFSPEKSIIRELYTDQIPDWVKRTPLRQKYWRLETNHCFHSGSVKSIEYSSDGRMVVFGTQGWKDCIHIWDAAMGQEQHVIELDTCYVKAIASSLHNQSLPANWKDMIRTWEVAIGQESLFTSEEAVIEPRIVAISPDARLKFVCNRKSLELWDLSRTNKRHSVVWRVDLDVTAVVAFSPDSQKMVTALDSDESIRLYDTRAGKRIKKGRILGYERGVSCLAMSTDGQVASGSHYGIVRLWDTAAAQAQVFVARASPNQVAIALDDRMVACMVSRDDTDHDVQVLDVATNKVRHMQKVPSDVGRFKELQFSPDSRWIVARGYAGAVLWETATGRKSCVVKLDHYCSSIKFSLNSRWLAIENHGTTEVWDVAAGKKKHKPSKAEFPFCRPLTAFSSDSLLLAVGDSESVILWDPATDQAISTLTKYHGVSDGVSAIELSPDGRWLAFGLSFQHQLVLLDLTTNQEHSLTTDYGEESYNYLPQIEFSSDSQILVSADHPVVFSIWDTASGKRLHGFDSPGEFAISPDSRLVVWPAAGSIQLWDTTARKERCLMPIMPSVEKLRFSSNGRYLITDCGTLELCTSSSAHLSSSQDWIQEGGRNLVYIHRDYRGDMAFVAGECVVFKNGRDSILQIDTSSNFRVG